MGRRRLISDVDIQTLYSMRKEGMKNREIAEKLDCSVQTVLNHIGPMPKKAEDYTKESKAEKSRGLHKRIEGGKKQRQPQQQNNASVIERLTAHDSYVLQFECTKVTANGKQCQYTIDTKAKTVTAHDGILAGTMTREELAIVILELKECMNKLTSVRHDNCMKE